MVCMGTGVMSQICVIFPYPYSGALPWLRDIGYCFWIVDVVLFGVFLAFLVTRYIRHPILTKKTVMEFPNSSYLGAIPIALDTIIFGIISFYSWRDSGRWDDFGIWWLNVALTLLATFGLLITQMVKQEEHSVSDVAGLWLMTSVPMVVTASTGAMLLPHFTAEPKVAVVVLVVSFLIWAAGLVLVHLILACYFWRLISYKLPQQQLLASGFLPLAPLGQGAYAAHMMSIYFSNYLSKNGFAPTQSHPPALSPTVLTATGEAIHWLGLISSLFLLAEATFWLVQATASMLINVPKRFNIGLWSLTFPVGSYANGWEYLSRDLRNEGMRGWAATLVVLSVVAWLVCALFTTYLGFWKGELFVSPGLEDWVWKEKQEDQAREQRGDGQSGRGRSHSYSGTYTVDRPCGRDEENGNGVEDKERND